jgi:hypothetical protein
MGACRVASFEHVLHTTGLMQLLLGFVATAQETAW